MKSREKVSLETIAREVGLSKYAVSRSLSGKSGVSEETRERIRETAQRLGYIRPVNKDELREIAVVFHDHDPVNSELYMQIQNGVQAQAHRMRHGNGGSRPGGRRARCLRRRRLGLQRVPAGGRRGRRLWRPRRRD